MIRKISARIRLSRAHIMCAALTTAVATSPSLADDHSKHAEPEKMLGAIFSAPLPDVPGKKLVVVSLKWPPTTKPGRVDHRHRGSVYVYVTEGTLRIGIEGEPVRELHVGESFFEPPGALHTVAESASSTQSASAIAVMVVPDGAPLVIPGDKRKLEQPH